MPPYSRFLEDAQQIEVPPSFLALFPPVATRRLTQPIDEVRDRYELCEDLAQMLVEHPSVQQGDDPASQRQVLAKTQQALEGEASPVQASEAVWVIRRLAELLGWEQPEPHAAA